MILWPSFGPVLRLGRLFQLLVQYCSITHWLVLFWSTSASLLLFGYLPWCSFSYLCLDCLSWALCVVLCFILFAYVVICSFSLFSRFRMSSSWLNISSSFWMEYNYFLFSCSDTGWSRVSLNVLSMFLILHLLFCWQFLSGWGLFPQIFWVDKACLHLPLGNAFFGY